MDLGIVQLASWGDVIISSALVHAIKSQRPDWRITYYVSKPCANAMYNNPHIDELVEINCTKKQAFEIWGYIKQDAIKRHESVIIPWAGIVSEGQWTVPGAPYCNFMWCTAKSIIELGLHFSLPLKTYLYPTQQEIDHCQFVNDIVGPKYLMEIIGESCQSHWNSTWTAQIVKTLIGHDQNSKFLISVGMIPEYLTLLKNQYPNNIICLNDYSLREASIIYNYCDTFIGLSPGTSNACNTHLCRTDTTWFEAINDRKWDSSPIRTKNKHFFYENNPVKFTQLILKNLSGQRHGI